MKSYKQLLNEWAQQTGLLHEITVEERTKLQRTLLSMYKDIDRLCEDNGLVVMLGGGSCLGAIRHQGFIPWDDDMDLLMPREDYDKFNPLVYKKGIVVASIAYILFSAGSLKPLQVISIAVSLPFLFIMLAMMPAMLKEMRRDSKLKKELEDKSITN